MGNIHALKGRTENKYRLNSTQLTTRRDWVGAIELIAAFAVSGAIWVVIAYWVWALK